MRETDLTFKLSLFGAGGVGKTSLTRRYLTGLFELDTKMTMGASIYVKYLDIEDKRVSLQIWDFGGEKNFQFLLPVYAMGSNGGIFMYDITRYVTLKSIEEWLSKFKEGLTVSIDKVPIIMVGGKLDLQEKRSVPVDEAFKLSKKFNFFEYIECSSKTGRNVEKVFDLMTRAMIKNLNI